MIVREEEPIYGVPSDSDYAIQSNLISRAAYRMPPMTRRLIFVATAQIQIKQDQKMWVEMSVGDLVRALDMNPSARSYQRIRESARSAIQQVFEVERKDGSWYMHSWIASAEYRPETDTIRLRFSEEMRPLLLELQRDFAKLSIADYGKLRGRHSQRLYELIMANSGFAGRMGNKPNEWWVRITTEKLRRLLKIADHEYPRTNDFRKRAVDAPVEEINDAQIGLRVTVEYNRPGRKLTGFTFHVTRTDTQAARSVDPATESQEEEEAWIAANPEAWNEAWEQAQKQKGLFGEMNVQAEAWELFSKRNDLIKPRRNRK
jgi:plasmid replication initiation protein